jgi:hypothetical protein
MQVALKALVVIHRLLRDGDPTFREELLNFTQRVQILQLSNFKDNSSPIGQYFWFSICNMTACLVQVNSVPLLCILIFFLYFLYPAWDYSSWVRTYGLFLEERLQCFRILKYDVEAESLPKQGQGPEKV